MAAKARFHASLLGSGDVLPSSRKWASASIKTSGFS
eukprot:CAMPEP_0181294276 /NCGR_PEP_ID=MMETSP1101-20121128/3510_1 /TAXON_ID=46948 /ORGANISM="Rhodomonas abbreviata, Strain Caron Lab Isolate" /LENGTH=35 /DNA_ID= /DNA_START= /DNA_END= /DNA_ORIENTATION=